MIKKSKIPKKAAKKSDKKTKKDKKSKKTDLGVDSGIVLIEDDLVTDKEKELEERRAYLEEARSQDSMD
tara:strand:+ start:110 stop:316 length:207 start_codon:yes stop_codon:yes gene_type:complete